MRTAFSIKFTTSCSVLLVGMVALSGCGGGDQPDLGLVTGRVTLEGEPLRKVEVSFIPTQGRPSYGQTDDEGKYELNYIRDIQGAKVGTHTILIRSGQVDNEKLAPVEVAPGENVIDIDCHRNPNAATDSAEEPEV